MSSYVRDASSTRNKAQESILEPNMSLAHTFHEFSFIFVCKNLLFLYPTRDNLTDYCNICLQEVSLDDMEEAKAPLIALALSRSLIKSSPEIRSEGGEELPSTALITRTCAELITACAGTKKGAGGASSF